MSAIVDIIGREVIDSRGNPTVECDVLLESGVMGGTLAAEIYGEKVTERHRHRYEANNHYLGRVEEAGLVVAARTPTESLCEIMELPRQGNNAHPWYVGVQYHPEFQSTPRDGHPLFISFIKAALGHQQEAKA